jgi:hypothetical protein
MSETHDGWEEVRFDEQPTPITVPLLTIQTREGKRFGAGRVYVNLFGTQFRCVALRAGAEKFIIQPEHGPDWLVERGLDRVTAERLVSDAMNPPEEDTVCG